MSPLIKTSRAKSLFFLAAFTASILVASTILPAQEKSKENNSGKKDKEVVDGKGNKGKDKDKESGKDKSADRGNKSGKEEKGRDGDMAGRGDSKDKGFPSNPRRGEKVTLCHKADDGENVTINVSVNALDAHLGHGDNQGECTRVAVSDNEGKKRDDDLVKKRSELYSDIEEARAMTDFGDELLNEARRRIELAKQALNQKVTAGTITQEVRSETEEIIAEAEREAEILSNAVNEARQEVNQVVSAAASLF